MQGRLRRMMRGAALLGVLAVCAMAGARPAEIGTPSVPVMVNIAREASGRESMALARERLARERDTALALLQSVIDDPLAQADIRQEALEKKTELALDIEREAATCALLAGVGAQDALALFGEGGVSLIVPWESAQDAASRARIVDAVTSQTGLEPSRVKIILAKK